MPKRMATGMLGEPSSTGDIAGFELVLSKFAWVQLESPTGKKTAVVK